VAIRGCKQLKNPCCTARNINIYNHASFLGLPIIFWLFHWQTK
jgi:hypothetical protein